MADIQPFRAFRYNLGRVGKLSDVVAPPYDVIDDAFRARLVAQHPNNVVNIDLPVGEDRYARAGQLFKDWCRDGVVTQDSARGFYVYHQDFQVDGQKHTRKGLLARIRLEPFSKLIVQPHEETFAGPKLDRLRLMEATAANLSPVFGLFPDDTHEVQNLLDAAVGRQPPFEATDHLGVVSRLWPVTDQPVLTKVTGLLGPKPVLIADGHHRYETCLTYRDQMLGAKAQQTGDEPCRFGLMMLVGMSDAGLVVQPTHRLIRGCGPINSDELGRRLQAHFDLIAVGRGDAGGRTAWERSSIEFGQGSLAFGIQDGTWILAKPRDLSAMAELAPEHTDDWRRLSVSVLHRLVIGRLFSDCEKTFQYEYVHLLDEALVSQRTKRCDLSVLVPAASVADVAKLANRGEKMPQKSTYFYPKLLTGLVFNPLSSN
jgi:uncharacterized protein (DUF1015 family)